MAQLHEDVPRRLTAVQVLLLAGEAEEAFDVFESFPPLLPDTDPETARVAEELVADIEAALGE